MELERKIAEMEDKVSNHSLAYDMLQEFKALNKRLFITIIALIIALVLSNLAWLYVFQSYDYVSTATATGFYALADSDGNVIAQDISPEAWDTFNEWWVKNGNSQENKNQN